MIDTFSATSLSGYFLLGKDTESTRWPDDEEFSQAWLHSPGVRGADPSEGSRIVLEALELAMYTGKTEKVTIDSKLTIEHVLTAGMGRGGMATAGGRPGGGGHEAA